MDNPKPCARCGEDPPQDMPCQRWRCPQAQPVSPVFLSVTLPKPTPTEQAALKPCFNCGYIGVNTSSSDDLYNGQPLWLPPSCDRCGAQGPSHDHEGNQLSRLEQFAAWDAMPRLPDVPSAPVGGGGEFEGINNLAYCAPGDRQRPTWLLFFDDPDRPYGLYYDEAEARDWYGRASQSWNCYLFELCNAAPSLLSRCTAMEGEVERLRHFEAVLNRMATGPSASADWYRDVALSAVTGTPAQPT